MAVGEAVEVDLVEEEVAMADVEDMAHLTHRVVAATVVATEDGVGDTRHTEVLTGAATY